MWLLDFGFWSRVKRAEFRARAAAHGFATRLHAPPDPGAPERLRRITLRDTGFAVSPSQMAQYEAQYQPPEPDELAWGHEMPPPGPPRLTTPRLTTSRLTTSGPADLI